MKESTLITKISRHLPLILLGLILFLVCLANYLPGTWLTGWDNLHPEFNFGLNIKRAFYSVWQEYQGLGLLSGMAHAADLFREIFLYIVSFLIPASFSRYFYHFLMLASGTVGVYFFVKKLLLKKSAYQDWVALVAACFYLLNFGTVQYFFTPFEPFSTFWGFFPWEMLVFFSFLINPSKRNLVILALVNLAASSQAYVQPVFLVYGLTLAVFSLIYLKHFYAKMAVLKVGIGLLAIFLVNAYWLIPNAYFVLTKVNVTREAMNNRMNTQRFYEWSRGHGNLKDFVLLRNMPYDTSATKDGLVDYMQPWRDYFRLPLVEHLSGLFFIMGVLGLFIRNRFRKYFLPLMGFLGVIFLSDLPVFDLANNLIRSLPLVGQVFRNPFTKLVVPLIFGLSLGIALSFEQLLVWTEKRLRLAREAALGGVILVCLVGLPIFAGQLFSDKVRVKIPQEYFRLFDYFAKQDANARIMNLPQDSFWGWGRYEWGSLGSGFLWYGIEQPILDRAFDVWSRESEGYYWETVFALRSKNQKRLNQVLRKYAVDYIVFDSSYTPSDQGSYRSLIKQQDLLVNNPRLKQAANFGSVNIYQIIKPQSKLRLIKKVSSGITRPYNHFDNTYFKIGDYISDSQPRLIYPFGSLFSSRFAEEAMFNVGENKEHYLLHTQIPAGKYILTIPAYGNDAIVPYELYQGSRLGQRYLQLVIRKPEIYLGNKLLKTGTFSSEYPLRGTADLTVIDSLGNQFVVGNSPGNRYLGSAYLLKNSPNAFYIEDGSLNPEIFEFNLSFELAKPQKYPLNLSKQTELTVWLNKKILGASKGNLINDPNLGQEGFYLQENQEQIGTWQQQILESDQNKILRTYAKRMSSDSWWRFPELPPASYLVKVSGRSLSGFPLTLNVVTDKEKQKVLHTLLGFGRQFSNEFFVIPPPESYDGGLEIRLNNHSFNSRPSVSEISEISLTAVPNSFLANISLEKKELVRSQATDLTYQKSNYTQYAAKINNPEGVITLFQAYDSGWRAYLNGKRLREHILVNNWANGWKIPEGTCQEECEVKIVFWPQYLQYTGFGLLIFSLIWIGLVYREPKDRDHTPVKHLLQK